MFDIKWKFTKKTFAEETGSLLQLIEGILAKTDYVLVSKVEDDLRKTLQLVGYNYYWSTQSWNKLPKFVIRTNDRQSDFHYDIEMETKTVSGFLHAVRLDIEKVKSWLQNDIEEQKELKPFASHRLTKYLEEAFDRSGTTKQFNLRKKQVKLALQNALEESEDIKI